MSERSRTIDISRIVDSFLLASLMAFTLLYYFYNLSEEVFWRDGRLGGEVIPTNTLGALASMLSVIGLFRLIAFGFSLSSVCALSAYAMVAALTLSRGAILSAFVAATICALFVTARTELGKRGRMSTVLIGLLVLIAAGLSLFFFSDDGIALLLRDNDTVDSLKTGTLRSVVWYEVLSGLGFNFVWGHGYAMLSDSGYVIVENLLTSHAHNGYIQVLAGMGVVGVLLTLRFAFFLWILSRASLQLGAKQALISLFLFFFFVVNNISESSVGFQIYPQFVFMFFFVLVLGAERKKDHRESAGQLS